MSKQNKPSNDTFAADFAAAESCVRAGAFGLILSLALITSVSYWAKVPDNQALSSYVAYRINLSASVEHLIQSVSWKDYLIDHLAAESITIFDLEAVRVGRGPTKMPPPLPPQPNLPIEKGNPTNRPAPPTNLTATLIGALPSIFDVADALGKLNDSDLLTKSRNASAFYNISIYRWALKRNNLYIEGVNTRTGAVNTEYSSVEVTTPSPTNSVPAIDKDEMIRTLTLSEVRELASYELPVVRDSTTFDEGEERHIDLGIPTMPRGLYPATVCAEALLLFVVLYLMAFTLEAISTGNFPASGTVFSALGRSRITIVALIIALLTPAGACVAVAAVAGRPLLTCLAGLVCLASVSTPVLLFRKGYLRRLVR
jgi:hypothetical protein